jgi:xanthine dehydrogenase accessory factor
LATLFDVKGSAPRGAGSQMVFSPPAISGFVSGGCIEADLAGHARQVLARRRPEILTYGEGGPLDIRLPCGSSIRVLLEPILPDDEAVTELLRLEKERRPAVWLTTGEARACRPVEGISDLPSALRTAAGAFAEAPAVSGHTPSPFALFRAFNPRTRVVAIGSDPIALAVVKLAAEMGFDAVLIRSKGPETCPLVGVGYSRADVPSALAACRPDPWTAVAVLSHDRDEEHTSLSSVLRTDAGYIGVLGSRRRVAERNERLIASGLRRADIQRVHAPIGLPIASKTTWEVAVSIMAEIVAEMRKSQLAFPSLGAQVAEAG